MDLTKPRVLQQLTKLVKKANDVLSSRDVDTEEAQS